MLRRHDHRTLGIRDTRACTSLRRQLLLRSFARTVRLPTPCPHVRSREAATYRDVGGEPNGMFGCSHSQLITPTFATFCVIHLPRKFEVEFGHAWISPADIEQNRLPDRINPAIQDRILGTR